MTYITVQVGQCGNQVGSELFSKLSNTDSTPSCFFRYKKDGELPIARSILVDMEPKVIHQCLTRSSGRKYRYLKENSFYKQSGSANNWGFGYSKQGPDCLSPVMNMIRKEVEKVDDGSFRGFLIITSLAGGTGSGVGTFLSEKLRDRYEKEFISNLIVWPYSEGEITLQNYNTVLSLSHLYESSDCIWFFLNDFISQICEQDLGIKRGSGFKDINSIIATITSNVLLPSHRFNQKIFSFLDDEENEKKKSSSSSPKLPPSSLFDSSSSSSSFSSIMETLCFQPSFKFISSKFYPFLPENSRAFQSDRWSGILKQLYQMMLVKDSYVHWNRISKTNVNKNIGSLVHLRGGWKDLPDLRIPLKPFWNPPNGVFTEWSKKIHSSSLLRDNCDIFYSKQNFEGNEKCGSVTNNSQAICKPLELILEKSSKMFQSSAYLHNYSKYGIEKEDFVQYFRQLEQVLYNYKNL